MFETEQRSGGPVTKVVNNNLNNFPIPIQTPVLSQRGPRFTDVSNYGVCGLWSRVTRHMTPSWLPLLSLELAMAALFSQGWNIPPEGCEWTVRSAVKNVKEAGMRSGCWVVCNYYCGWLRKRPYFSHFYLLEKSSSFLCFISWLLLVFCVKIA